MSAESYVGLAFAEWQKYIIEEPEYYCTRAEKQAIAKGAAQAASKLSGLITIVARGGASKFPEKDGAVAKEFEKAGCTIAGVVYMDSSLGALKEATTAGQQMFPNAWHHPVQGDFYDRFLRYPVEGTEVNTLFGFPMENVEGFLRDAPPKDKYIENATNMNLQMSPGAHLITTIDTFQDKAGIEKAYGGPRRNRYARAMLIENDLGHLPLIFAGQYYPESYIYTHNYEVTRRTKLPTITGLRDVPKGERLHYKSTLKLPFEVKLEWQKRAGSQCLAKPEDIAFDDEGKVALLHFRNDIR